MSVTVLFCPACRCTECGSDTATWTTGDEWMTCENGHQTPAVPHSERCLNAHLFDCPNCGRRVEPVFTRPPLRDVDAPYVLHVSVRCPNGCF